MDVQEFWEVVNATRDDDPAVQVDRLRSRLKEGGAEAREGFAACFVGLMRHACDWQLWDALEVVFGGMDDETFFGVRAWLVSRGPDTYQEALCNADSLATHRIFVFPEFAHLAGGEDLDLANLEDSFVGVPIQHDDESGFESAFPTLYQRHRSLSARARASQRALFSSRESAEHVRRVRLRAGAGSLLVISAMALLLPWWVAIPVGIGILVAASAWLLRRSMARLVGAFVSRARNVGNARQLRGEIEVAVVYLEPEGTQVAAPVKRTISDAFALLADEAQRHGVELRFRRVQPDPVRLTVPRLYHPAFRDFDRDSVNELKTALAPLVPVGNGFVLVVTTEHRCTPTAWPATRFYPRALEFCVCPVQASAATIAHEILHLFGARDLYRTSRPGGWTKACLIDHAADFVEARTGQDVRETSIMTNHSDHSEVDPLTAVAVGWSDRIAGRSVPLFGEEQAPQG